MPEYYDAPYLSEQEHTLLDHIGVPGVPTGANIRWFTEPEVAAAHGKWTYSVADLVVPTGTAIYPQHDTFVGDSDNFSLTESPIWEQPVPQLDSPGIYTVQFWAAWPNNTVGIRFMFFQPFTEPNLLGGPYQRGNYYNSAGPGENNAYTEVTLPAVYVYDTPVRIGTKVFQTSGSSLTIAKANLAVEANKLAEFL